MTTNKIVLHNYYNITLNHVCGEIPSTFWNHAPHIHDHCEIFIHLRGKLRVCVENHLYHIPNRSIRLYNSSELHYGNTDTMQTMEWYQISLPQAFLRDPKNNNLLSVLYNRLSGEKNVFTCTIFHEITELLQDTFAEYHNGNILYPHYCQSAVLKILCLINEQKHHIYASACQTEQLQKIMDMICTDFPRIYSINELSMRCNYSNSYIHKLFKEQLNITPYQFLIDKKLTEAKKCLQQGKNVSETCSAVGFENYNHFITLFKRRFGITPNKYRMLP